MTETQAPRDTFTMTEAAFFWLSDRIERLNKRAAKLALPAIGLEVINAEQVTAEDGLTVTLKLTVKVTGTSPKFDGWHFIATLAHIDGEVIIRAMPGETVPAQYRTAAPACEHCKTERNRKETFIIGHETGRTAQVGRNCIADFLGAGDPARLAAMAELINGAIDAADEAEAGLDDYGPRVKTRLSVRRLAALTLAHVAAEGWMSATKARELMVASTADLLMARLSDGKHYEPSEAQVAEADAAMEWAATLDETGSGSDYEHNLAAIARLGSVETRQIGFAASLPIAYRRSQEREREAQVARKTSAPVGTAGERREFTLSVTGTRELETAYGLTYLYLMVDGEGNRFKYFSSRHIMDEGETFTLKATIKGHETYNGIAQTVITRGKVTAEHGKTPAA